VLPTSTKLDFSSSSSSNGTLPLAVPAAAWWPLVHPDSGMDVLSCEHLNSFSRSSQSGSSSSMFVALVDSDDAPDGEVVLIHTKAPGSSNSGDTHHPTLVSTAAGGGVAPGCGEAGWSQGGGRARQWSRGVCLFGGGGASRGHRQGGYSYVLTGAGQKTHQHAQLG
jgi:phage-related tail fiber protein